MDKIKKYYRLLKIKPKNERPVNIYNQIPISALKVIFTDKEFELYFTNGYKLKENIIGGKKEVYAYKNSDYVSKNDKILII